MSRSVIFGLIVGAACGLAGCAPSYSPDSYASSAVQQANKVDTAVVVGYREVSITANGTVGAVTGGAAGGILGADSSLVGINSALGTVGGSLIGSLIGTTVEHVTGDTTGWEYIVRKPNGDMLSVTQREPKPLPVGQKVLVISGSQARIIPDYSVAPEPPAAAPAAPEPAPAPAAPTPVPTPAPVVDPAPPSGAAPASGPEAEKGKIEVQEIAPPPPAVETVPPAQLPASGSGEPAPATDKAG